MTDTSPWDFQGESSPLSTTGSTSTLVDGRVLAISSSTGDINGSHGPQGLFFLDSRIISRYETFIDGKLLSPLGVSQSVSFAADYVSRHIDDSNVADYPLTSIRHRTLGKGMIDTLEVRNYSTESVSCQIAIAVRADFAHLFAVKEGRATKEEGSAGEVVNGTLSFSAGGDSEVGLAVSAKPEPDDIRPGTMIWQAEIPAGDGWKVEISFGPKVAGEQVGPHATGDTTAPKERHAAWFQKVPKVTSDNSLISNATKQSLIDLESLRIFNPSNPDRAVVAAGAPWFMTLFGRDSLLTSWMSMIVDPDLASGVLQTLAQFQGSKVDPDKEEEPGKIMHEVRFSGANSANLEAGDFYYGTADATPLFVMTVGELDRWGESPEVVKALMPNVDRAMDWIINYGDADGDGYVEYDRSFKNSLFNQGWKDSGDGIRFADGRIPETPMALCEIQAYVYGAFKARERLALRFDEPEIANEMNQRAQTLREKFNQDFWIEDKGWIAVGLDGEKNQIDSLTSNIGHCLWTGIVDQDKAERIARHLMSDVMFNGWGIRTMASNTVGFNPTGYHTGSVWPHDSALVAAGLMRYGFVEQAHELMMGLLELAQHSDWRLPELTGGFARSEFSEPIAYPASCSPQAWSAASTLLILRWMLRIDPWCPEGRIWIDPVLPAGFTRLKVENIRIAGHRVTVSVNDGEVDVSGLPEDLTWHKGHRSIAPRDRW